MANSVQNSKGSSNVCLKRVHVEDEGYAQEHRKKKACAETRTEHTYAPYYDGYQWRKYGQKMIRGTAFPRCYYRCTYHQEHDCPATKHVQQHNLLDPPLFRIIYKNQHTCNAVSKAAPFTSIQRMADASLRKVCKPTPALGYFAIKEEEKEGLVNVTRNCDAEIQHDSLDKQDFLHLHHTVVIKDRPSCKSCNLMDLNASHIVASLPQQHDSAGVAEGGVEDVSSISSLLLTSDDAEMGFLSMDAQWFGSLDWEWM